MEIGYIYQEVYELLCGLNPTLLKKIPSNILEEINLKRNKNYKTNIDVSDLYNPNNISKEAFELYMNLDYEYLMTQEEREYIDGEE